MSFTSSKKGSTFSAGFFLIDDEDCLRETALISPDHAQKVTRGHSTIVPAGAVIPANDATAKGILYEDIDVTYGEQLGSIVTTGTIYGDRLPAALASAAATALKGIRVAGNSPAVERPFEFGQIQKLEIEASEGTASGDAAFTVSGYTPKTGETYKYKAGNEYVQYGDVLTTGWTAWDGDDDITVANGTQLTFAVVTAGNQAVAYGVRTAVTKA